MDRRARGRERYSGMRPPDTTTPPGSGAASQKKVSGHSRDGPNCTTPRNIRTTCDRALHDLAASRREHRDLSPELSDAIDNAMDSLKSALTICELEGWDDGE